MGLGEACFGDLRHELRITDEEKIVANAIAAIGGDEGERLGLRGHFEV